MTGSDEARRSGIKRTHICYELWEDRNYKPIVISGQVPYMQQGSGYGYWPEIYVTKIPVKKLNPRYVGPFKMIRQVTPVSFHLELPNHYRVSPTFHMSLLKPSGGPWEVSSVPDERALPITIEGEVAY